MIDQNFQSISGKLWRVKNGKEVYQTNEQFEVTFDRVWAVCPVVHERGWLLLKREEKRKSRTHPSLLFFFSFSFFSVFLAAGPRG